MSDPVPAVRALAFGTPDGSLWGAACEQGTAVLALGGSAGERPVAVADGLRWSLRDDGEWRLEGDGVELTVTPVSPEAGEPAADAAPAAPELCRVRGTIAERDVECPGTRVTATGGSGKSAPATARLVGAWFADGAALGLLALRPRRARHQDGDAMTATVFEPGEWIVVDDPRLSTTYDGAGVPTRANLELWISEGETEYPRRAAGETAGPAGTVAAADGTDGVALQVIPLRCHSRGEEGAGVYALATFSGSRS